MTGLNPFVFDYSFKFQRSLKRIATVNLKQELEKYLNEIIDNPYHSDSRQESQPKGFYFPIGWTFHKLEFKIGKGASDQIRLMYLVNETRKVILLLWIYNHEQYPKRPSDKDIKDVIKSALEDYN